ncbi:MAG TPA: PQQ-binding-like beta-propeller repeat protein, partial [Myxococcaceae bacterium]|nr:PQQ-binding-like beta-propeller repeat protein [Myxococcaceae bacterium]
IGNPIVAGGTVFVTGVDGSLHAFDPDGSVHLARANGWIYPYLASATPQTTGAHQLQLMVSGTGPVHLAILVDGNPILDFTDDQPGAIEAPGSTGLFSWQGAGPTYQHFIAVQP